MLTLSLSFVGNEPPAKKYKSALKGHDWETFKSKHKDRIFSHVLNKPDDTLVSIIFYHGYRL